MSEYNCPPGSNTKDAPWNQEKQPKRLVPVTISITLSKTEYIWVDDYTIVDSGINEDGEYFEKLDYSDCNLQKLVKEQVTLPQDAWNYITPKSRKKTQALIDLKDWNVDELEVIQE